MPTYPSPAPSVNLVVQPQKNVRVAAGVYRRDLEGGKGSHSSFAIGEIGVVFGGHGVLGPRRAVVGTWRDTATIEGLDGSPVSGTQGFYALFEQRFDLGAKGRWLDAFVQYGNTDERLGEVGQHAALGVVAPSPFAGRRADAVGFMISHVDLSDLPGAGFSNDETTFELFYAVSLTPFWRLKPDVQLVRNPSGRAGDGLVATLRVELAF